MALLRGISPFIKNLAFKDEEEYRLAFYLGSDEVKVYSRLTNGLNIVNYIKVKIPLSALDHITIGPCADFDKTKKLLLENMRSCNIEKKDRNDFIRPSKVPYRIY